MKKRKDCFFGLHYDFHANDACTEIGKDFDNKTLETLLYTVRPDYIQCDTKGHRGLSSYPTKVGNPAPQLQADILKKWREITLKYDVPLFAHHSGVYETEAADLHPEWAAVDAEGKVTEMMSVFGDYADKLLIPQLKEIAVEYGLNGAWVDGECWATLADYSAMATDAYKKATGKIAPKPDEEGYEDYQSFCRAGFLRYVEHYVNQVKKAAPDFEITSNWLNSSFVPDDVCITDFISGDYDSDRSVEKARMEGRIMAEYEGRAWDLMAWSFRASKRDDKTAIMLKQEAAAAISLGGGFQIYYKQRKDGSIEADWAIPIIDEVAKFCRERQAFCHKATPIHEAALVLSPEAYYKKRKNLFGFGKYLNGWRGTMNMLVENQIATEALLTHNAMTRDLSAYSLIVVSNSLAIEDELKTKLLSYANNGGALVLIGEDTSKIFATELSIEGEVYTDKPILEIKSGVMYGKIQQQPYMKIEGKQSQTVSQMKVFEDKTDLQSRHPAPMFKDAGFAPATIRIKQGKGTVTLVPFDLGGVYFDKKSSVLRNFFKDAVSAANLKLCVSGSHYVDVALMEKDGKTYLHFVNCGGEHCDVRTTVFDEIPPLYNIKVEYVCPKPKRVVSRPDGKLIDFTYKDNKLSFIVDKLDIYTIIELA